MNGLIQKMDVGVDRDEEVGEDMVEWRGDGGETSMMSKKELGGVGGQIRSASEPQSSRVTINGRVSEARALYSKQMPPQRVCPLL